ncbi:MAG: hypothetical protein HC838_11965, partial [Spirulinaceae cyanobacterium RM2_2_10]|nr:hypothetical protein [Spirulinaceae cyanobacterium RM2_2_10]
MGLATAVPATACLLGQRNYSPANRTDVNPAGLLAQFNWQQHRATLLGGFGMLAVSAVGLGWLARSRHRAQSVTTADLFAVESF